jgi:hypothetical protein
MGISGQSKFLTILIMVIVGAATRFALRAAFNSTPIASHSKFEDEIYKELENDPKFKEHFSSLSSKEAHDEGMKLASRGLRRLSTDDLLSRARILHYILEHSDEQACASITMGGPDATKQFMSALEKVPDEMQKEWATIAIHSVKAELAGGVYVEPPTSDMQAGYAELADKLSKEDRETMMKLNAGGMIAKSANPKEICEAGKSIYRSMPQLSSRSQEVVAHAIVSEGN